jgi:hypothetical protein
LFGGEVGGDGADVERLRALEERVVFGRVTLVFGWCGDGEGRGGERVVVLGVLA